MTGKKHCALYIHGFNSAGFGTKVNWLRKFFGNVINPNLPLDTKKAVDMLEYLSRNLKNDDIYSLILVGSSLGGYYALHLANKFDIPAILINPLVRTSEQDWPTEFELQNLKTEEIFVYRREYSLFLKEIEVKPADIHRLKERIFIFIDKGDDVIDWRKSEEIFEGFYFKKYDEGSHFFDHMKDLIEDLKDLSIFT
jgi:predicted esterase YcpF (UPF0227 family)